MGQQQLLLIVLGVIIVGIAILLGITLFRTHALEQKRNHIVTELMSLGNMAQKHYNMPTTMGGGGRSFEGWQIPNDMKRNFSASYEITGPDGSEIEITAVGSELVTDTDSLIVKMKILPKDFIITYTNY